MFLILCFSFSSLPYIVDAKILLYLQYGVDVRLDL